MNLPHRKFVVSSLQAATKIKTRKFVLVSHGPACTLNRTATLPVYSNTEVPTNAQVAEFVLSDDCCTCFGYHYHLSSGAQNNCNYSI
jgi:hypothetical protein